MTIRLTALSIALLALAGCKSAADTASTDRDFIERRFGALEAKVSELQIESDKKDKEIAELRGTLIVVMNAHESLRKTFNGNVDQSNKAKVAALTARGACGTELVRYPDGGQAYRNRECTLKDLR